MSDAMIRLSAKSFSVLEMIAAGRSYEQILSVCPGITYLDIFHAAEEALALAAGLAAGSGLPAKKYTLDDKRKKYPRAYLPWSEDEDRSLETFVHSGETVARIAGRLQRNRGAIRSRLAKLNLVNQLTAKEQERFRRCSPDLIDQTGRFA